MTPENWLFSEIKKRGISMKHISDVSGISYNVIFEASKGRRTLKVLEFCDLCKAASIQPVDYFSFMEKGVAANA